jgi:hypothetical protein
METCDSILFWLLPCTVRFVAYCRVAACYLSSYYIASQHTLCAVSLAVPSGASLVSVPPKGFLSHLLTSDSLSLASLTSTVGGFSAKIWRPRVPKPRKRERDIESPRKIFLVYKYTSLLLYPLRLLCGIESCRKWSRLDYLRQDW